MNIQHNLQQVNDRIRAAAERAGRSPEEVRLVGVTKTVGVEEIRLLHQLGLSRIGESRIQDARDKVEACRDLSLEWHLIGHLQRNKVKYALRMFEWIHSVDSLRLAEEISRRAEMKDQSIHILLEVNVSGEESKFGMERDSLFDLVQKIDPLPGLHLEGLMTMAPFVDDPEQTRPYFRKLRQLLQEINDKQLTREPLVELSMGMTNDFEVAVEEGATFVRVGSALFM
jgi:PLP dependent protein